MLAVSVTMVVMNIILMRLAGSDGVAAAAIVLSAQTILSAVYMGYLEGIAPLISYNYGKGDIDNLKRLYNTALKVIALLSVATFAAAFPLAKPIAVLYAGGVSRVVGMSVDGIFAISGAFLLMGVNMFASSMFTALNDGKTSAILALFRTLIFLLVPLLILPPIFGIWGVWAAPAVAEVLSVLMSVYYFAKKKTVYRYA